MYISKTKLVLIGILAASLLIIVTAYSQNRLSQGQQPYTPNRLEWLELVLVKNYLERYRTEDPHEQGWRTKYVAVPKENTIRVEIDYDKDMKADTLQRIIDIHKEVFVLPELIQRGWQDWCKIKIHTKPVRYLKTDNAGTQREFVPVDKPY